MAEAAIYLTDTLIPLVPVRQFVVTFPPPLRLWLARSQTLAAKICRRVSDALSEHLQRESGIKDGLTGSVMFIQRFGSGANLNVHCHIIVLDGAYEEKSTGRLKFYTAKAPTAESITRLVQVIAKRVNKHVLKKGYLEEFEDLTVLGNTEDIFSAQRDDVHLPAQGASVSHRIAFGPQAGQPVRRIKTSHSTWPAEDDVEATSDACVKAGGYSVHAATAMKSHERERMEKLVRYMARPAIAEERLALLPDGSIRLQLKTSWRDGTQFLLFTPSEFIEKLIALVPLPKFHLTRYYGVFAKASKYRDKLPDRPPPKPDDPNASSNQPTPPRKNKLLPSSKRPGGKMGAHKIRWAALLKRTFAIDVLQCGKWKSRMRLVAVVCDSPTIQTTLTAMGMGLGRIRPIAH